jgi:hypothetical protein
VREAFGRRTVHSLGHGNFVGDSLRDGAIEIERAHILQLRDSRADLGELESPAILRTYRSLLVFRGDLVVACNGQADGQVGRWIVCHPLCDDRVQKRPLRESGAKLEPVEDDRVVSIHMFHNLAADKDGWIPVGLEEAAVVVEAVCDDLLWRGPNDGRSSSK